MHGRRQSRITEGTRLYLLQVNKQAVHIDGADLIDNDGNLQGPPESDNDRCIWVGAW